MSAKIDIDTIECVGEIIQFHRKKAGLTRIELAMIAGVGKTVIYDIEHGKKTLHFITLLKILEALNISISIDSPLIDLFIENQNAKS